jgi:8-oxo-dGTP diphosphatase
LGSYLRTLAKDQKLKIGAKEVLAMKKFNVGIKALIVRDDKILLVRRVDTPPFWDVPGGRIDDNEAIEETLDRELHEELPNIESYQVHGIVDASRLHKDIKPGLSLVLVFYSVTAEFRGGEPELSSEHDEYKWLTKTEALEAANITCRAAIEKVL